jgi:4-amino-4-deoxy-L-arabinose transferase-like glycosyltransferase
LVWLAGLRPLWLDEVLTLAGAVKPTVHELLVWVGFNPGSSPLGFLIERPFIETMGLTRLAARLPSILFSILSAIALAGFARDLKLPRGHSLLLIVYLALPIQLRYAVEARPYAAALFFTISALWCLWRLLEESEVPERPSWWLAVTYALLVAVGLYAQPFAAFVQVGALAALALSSQRRAVVVAAVALAAGCLLFAPWYLHVREAWRQEIASSGYTTTFTPRSLLILVREMAGGGYWQSIPLLLAACLGWPELPPRVRRFLLGGILLGASGAMAADAASGYFFAARHALFVVPELVVLATAGFTASRHRSGRYRWLGCALAAVLIASSIVKSWGYFRGDSEDWPGAAKALLAEARAGACVIVPQPEPEDLYAVFEPELRQHFCTASTASGLVGIIETYYTVPVRLQETAAILTARGFHADGEAKLPGGVRLLLYGRVP